MAASEADAVMPSSSFKIKKPEGEMISSTSSPFKQRVKQPQAVNPLALVMATVYAAKLYSIKAVTVKGFNPNP